MLEINKKLLINYMYFSKIIFFNEKDLLPCLLTYFFGIYTQDLRKFACYCS